MTTFTKGQRVTVARTSDDRAEHVTTVTLAGSYLFLAANHPHQGGAFGPDGRSGYTTRTGKRATKVQWHPSTEQRYCLRAHRPGDDEEAEAYRISVDLRAVESSAWFALPPKLLREVRDALAAPKVETAEEPAKAAAPVVTRQLTIPGA